MIKQVIQKTDLTNRSSSVQLLARLGISIVRVRTTIFSVAVLITNLLIANLLIANQSHADCQTLLSDATLLTKKARFFYAKGHSLNDRIASAFKGDEAQFIANSQESYKPYYYEMAIYNYAESKKFFGKAISQYEAMVADTSCEPLQIEAAKSAIKSNYFELTDTKRHFAYFNCQYLIDHSRKSLQKSFALKDAENYSQAQLIAAETRKTVLAVTAKEGQCSDNQVAFGQDLYRQAWDIITETNKPLEQQYYCESKLNKIVLTFKDADVAVNQAARKEAIQHWQSAKTQIKQLIADQACPKSSVTWLKEKAVLAQQELERNKHL